MRCARDGGGAGAPFVLGGWVSADDAAELEREFVGGAGVYVPGTADVPLGLRADDGTHVEWQRLGGPSLYAIGPAA